MLIDSCYLCSRVAWNNKLFCDECWFQLTEREFIFRHQGELSTYSLFLYKDQIRDFILKCKQGLNSRLSKRLSDALTKVFLTHTTDKFRGVIPIPNSKGNLRDHAYLLAKQLAENLGLPLCDGHLTALGDGKSQKTKSLNERMETQFGLKSPLLKGSEGVWILVDDVITTGATLSQAHKALGKPPAVCLTLATRPYILVG